MSVEGRYVDVRATSGTIDEQRQFIPRGIPVCRIPAIHDLGNVELEPTELSDVYSEGRDHFQVLAKLLRKPRAYRVYSFSFLFFLSFFLSYLPL